MDYHAALNSNQGRLVRCLGLKVFAEEWRKRTGKENKMVAGFER
jgi:hypothetical protein